MLLRVELLLLIVPTRKLLLFDELLPPTAPQPRVNAGNNPVSAPIPPTGGAAGTTLAESEKAQILAAIAAHNGNKSRAAEALGISRRTMHRKLNGWNLK